MAMGRWTCPRVSRWLLPHSEWRYYTMEGVGITKEGAAPPVLTNQPYELCHMSSVRYAKLTAANMADALIQMNDAELELLKRFGLRGVMGPMPMSEAGILGHSAIARRIIWPIRLFLKNDYFSDEITQRIADVYFVRVLGRRRPDIMEQEKEGGPFGLTPDMNTLNIRDETKIVAVLELVVVKRDQVDRDSGPDEEMSLEPAYGKGDLGWHEESEDRRPLAYYVRLRENHPDMCEDVFHMWSPQGGDWYTVKHIEQYSPVAARAQRLSPGEYADMVAGIHNMSWASSPECMKGIHP